VINEAGRSEAAQFDRLYEVLFARHPSPQEKRALKQFPAQQEKVISQKVAESSETGRFSVAVPKGLAPQAAALNPIRAAAFVDLVHTVTNSNDFAYRF